MFQFLHIVFALARYLVHLLDPIRIPLCFVGAWVFIGLIAWGLISAARESVHRAQHMHQIPCANCRFFTGDYHLKCPVKPSIALTDAAIHCSDFESANPYASSAIESSSLR